MKRDATYRKDRLRVIDCRNKGFDAVRTANELGLHILVVANIYREESVVRVNPSLKSDVIPTEAGICSYEDLKVSKDIGIGDMNKNRLRRTTVITKQSERWQTTTPRSI